MSNIIQLGTWVDGDLPSGHANIDLARLLESMLLVQAASGGGKSWLIRRLLEQTAGLIQQIIIDPEGEFATLRERHDLVIAAAHGGDALAHPSTARLLAERLLETNVSAVIDLYDLKVGKKNGKPFDERAQFVEIFIDTIVNAPKRLWHPVLIVIDEAHMFCPEVGDSPSAGAVINLSTRGRKRGFCLVAATQRIAQFSKAAAGNLHNKVIGLTSLDVDLRRAAGDLGIPFSEARTTLRSLNPGEFYAFGPAIGNAPQRMKSGPVKTTHPKAGQRLLQPPPKPTAAIKAILPQLADLPKEAEEEARTVEQLRVENARLKREANVRKPIAALVPADQSAIRSLEETIKNQRAMLKQFQLIQSEGVKLVERLNKTLAEDVKVPDAVTRIETHKQQSVAPRIEARQVIPPADGEISGPEQRILDAIAWLEAIGITPANQTAVAFLANYTIGGGAFNNPRGRLNKRGLIEYVAGDKVQLTDDGRQYARPPEDSPTTEELHRRVMNLLPGPEKRLLQPLLDSYPDPMTNDELAAAANYEPGGGAFNNPRGRLKSLGLIEYPAKGIIVASSVLFLGIGRS